MKLSPIKPVSENTVVPVWDQSVEMEVQVSKYDYNIDDEPLSAISQRIHDVCDEIRKENIIETIKSFPGKCCQSLTITE